MTKVFLYPKIIKNIKYLCDEFMGDQLGVENLQIGLYNAGDQIVAYEEKAIREFLVGASEEIEIIKFTIDDDKQIDEIKKITLNVLDFLDKYHNGD